MNTIFSERLKLLRKEKNISAEELANKLNINKSTISRYENDKTEPYLPIVLKIAKYFDVSLDWIAGISNIRESYITPNNILKLYIEKYYNEKDDKQTWFDRIKELAGELGYAKEVKEYKANPDAYKAHVGDVSTVIRVALTGRTNTPDMYEIMQVLGKESVIKRLESAIK